MAQNEAILSYMTNILTNYIYNDDVIEEFHLHWLIGSNNMLSLPRYNNYHTIIANTAGVDEIALNMFFMLAKIFKIPPRKIIEAIDSDTIDEMMADASIILSTCYYRKLQADGVSFNNRWVLRGYLQEVASRASE